MSHENLDRIFLRVTIYHLEVIQKGLEFFAGVTAKEREASIAESLAHKIGKALNSWLVGIHTTTLRINTEQLMIAEEAFREYACSAQAKENVWLERKAIYLANKFAELVNTYRYDVTKEDPLSVSFLTEEEALVEVALKIPMQEDLHGFLIQSLETIIQQSLFGAPERFQATLHGITQKLRETYEKTYGSFERKSAWAERLTRMTNTLVGG